MSYLDKIFDLNGKVAVITGGGGVLASEIGQGLAFAGVKIAFVDIHEEAARQSAQKIVEAGGEAIGLRTNVLDMDELKATREKVLERYGMVDILLNAAGGNLPGATIAPDESIFNINLDDLNKVTELNYNGSVFPSLVFGELMAGQRSGSIINISSMAALRTITRVWGYSAAKAAVTAFTRCLYTELRPHGIAVGLLVPGGSNTGFQDAAAGAETFEWDEAWAVRPEHFADMVYQWCALSQGASVSELVLYGIAQDVAGY